MTGNGSLAVKFRFLVTHLTDNITTCPWDLNVLVKHDIVRVALGMIALLELYFRYKDREIFCKHGIIFANL